MLHVLDGELDEVTLYHRALSQDELDASESNVPCARDYKGSGFAYFPGQVSEHGAEYAEFGKVPECNDGPHTVRFRYLVSKGNNRRLALVTSDDNIPTAPVEFPEPYRYDSEDIYTWRQSPPALVSIRGKNKGKPEFRLTSEAPERDGAAEEGSIETGQSNPELANINDAAGGDVDDDEAEEEDDKEKDRKSVV